jgi:histone H3/H4
MSDEEGNERWEKGGGGFGPITKGSRRLGIKMPIVERGKPEEESSANPEEGRPGKRPRLKAGDRALLEIERYQRDGGYLIPKVAFWRLAREIFEGATKGSGVSRIERSAVEALQTMTEAHLAMAFNSKFSFNSDLIFSH